MINLNEPLDIIFIAGAPGSGKSTIAKGLQDHLKTPCFEFGWIPEFQDRGDGKPIGYVEEESIAFENLVLVVKNYINHNFKNIIVTDLQDNRILDLHNTFADINYILVTLVVMNDEILKYRVLEPSRSSTYRDFQAAINISKTINSRNLLPHETRIDATNLSVDKVTKKVISIVDNYVL